MTLKRLIGGPFALYYAGQFAPGGYMFSPPGFGYSPGRMLAGPGTDTTVTVCLLPDDNGVWFRDLVKRTPGGWVREEDYTCG
jgi:hypothetical protein